MIEFGVPDDVNGVMTLQFENLNGNDLANAILPVVVNRINIDETSIPALDNEMEQREIMEVICEQVKPNKSVFLSEFISCFFPTKDCLLRSTNFPRPASNGVIV